MCARYHQRTKLNLVLDQLQAEARNEGDWSEAVKLWDTRPHYDIGIGGAGLVIRGSEEPRKVEPAVLKWGLIPFWSKDGKMISGAFNARGETVAEKPTFRTPFKKRRCVIPADGFFEWFWLDEKGKKKQKYFIHLKEDRPYFFAGIWDRCENVTPTVESYSMLTTEPNDLMTQLHDRMPVFLTPAEARIWLNPSTPDTSLLGLIDQYPADEMEAWPVANQTKGEARYDGPEAIEQISVTGVPFGARGLF
jgi:putative SOS response-associated peptidase YedK